MEMKILNDKENALLKRREVHFLLTHENDASPSRKSVKDLLSNEIGEKKDFMIIDNMKSQFGHASAKGYAKIYKTKEDALYFESDAILTRNNMKEKKKDEKRGA